MLVDHPFEWELSRVSGLGEPGRCTFSDRFHQRLDLRWRPLKYVPNLELMIEKYRPAKDDKTTVRRLDDGPEHWQGLVRRPKEGTVVHAIRFFVERRWLAEATIVWSGRRDVNLERTVLESVQPQDTTGPQRQWRAMGIDMSIASQFELHKSVAKVGRVTWRFRNADKPPVQLAVERIAMPEYWLDKPLADWLAEQVPAKLECVREEPFIRNGHRGQQLFSEGRVAGLAGLRGIRQLRLDAAWLCPVENRVYHLELSRQGRQDAIAFDQDLQIRCCTAVPALAGEPMP